MTEATHDTADMRAGTGAEISTVVLRRGTGVSASGSEAGSDPLTTAVSPLTALAVDERARTRLVVLIMYALHAMTMVALPLLGGDPTVKGVSYALLAVTLAATAGLDIMNRHPRHQTAGRVAAVWLLDTVTVCTLCLYFGVFSPAPMVLVLGVYFIALGQSRWLAWTVYALSAGFHAVAASLIATGLAADPGVVVARWETPGDQRIVGVMIQGILLATALLGRWSRQATLFAIEQLERAVRTAAARKALLQEAEQALDRALRPRGPGRMTDRRLGSFELGRLLGRGAMGEVYEATHVTSGEIAAVKILHAGGMSHPHALARFLREVDVARSLQSPHIVRVLEHGELGDVEIPYLAMERLYGEDLAQHLRSVTSMPLSDVVELVRQVAAGVDAAAAAGVVHRDLKPENLFRSKQGSRHVWKILDFGVSKLIERGGTLTHGNVVGTPNYMAPEQATGSHVDHRADVYSLGVIAYRAVTGHPPFGGNDIPAILMAVVHAMPAAPSSLTAVPSAVDDVLAVAMAKQPPQRFDSAGELAAALARAAQGEIDDAVRARARAAQLGSPWGGRAARSGA